MDERVLAIPITPNITEMVKIGKPMGVPIIRELKKWKQSSNFDVEILDSPPGASCPVVETIRGSDFALLVTEPTPFGLHDLKKVVGIVEELKIPAGVIINRDGIGDNAVADYCKEQGIPVLLRIPMERKIAEAIARGETLIHAKPEYKSELQHLLGAIIAEVLN